MNMKNDVLRLLIKKIEIDELKDVITDLQLLLGDSKLNLDLISIKGRLSELERNQHLGTINRENYTIEKNKIRGSLLEIINSYQHQEKSSHSDVDRQFIEYANDVVEMYESRDIKKYFLFPELKKQDKHIMYYEFLGSVKGDEKDYRLTLLLGNFGSGKSVLMENLFYQLSINYLVKRKKIPIFIRLRTYKGGEDIQTFILRTINQRYGIDISQNDLLKHQRKGRFIFILDGFDEMLGHITTESLKERILQIENLLSDGVSEVIISCRTHFFHTSASEDILNFENKYYLQPWNVNQVLTYLNKRIPNNNKVYDSIENTYNLSELAKTPLFLEMIIKSLSQDLFRVSPEVNSASLYSFYTEKWFETTVVRKGSILSKSQKRNFIEKLAWKMINQGQYFISIEKLLLLIEGNLDVKKTELAESFLNDITNCSFLTREGNFFEFSHASFMEFFAAVKIVNEIKVGIYDSLLATLRSEIYVFCAEILKNLNVNIDYNKVISLKHDYITANVMTIAYRIQDKDSIHFFEKVAEQNGLHHCTENLIVTGIAAYPFEYPLKILTKLFYKSDNSLTRFAIQNFFRYSKEDISNNFKTIVTDILEEKIKLKHSDASAIFDNSQGIIKGYLHGLRLHRLSLEKDSRWIIVANIGWLFAVYDYREAIPLLEYYAKNSKEEIVVKISKQCLAYFYTNE